ncbi:PREDICTED: cation/H(+) antiporter 21-like [Camelina sativa]|uniref:Cation/H(+) antiporter 21-like n=1 Tax=Camelina sativa TaxID=90675 RepID=A0ABM0ZB96_CAMSA|nr:PREDICTED: cation/H(+) antiporter 21-like [Camelina sativa]
MVLETFANLALVYNVFLLGLGMDLRMIKIKDTKPVIIAIVGLVAALLAGTGFYYLPSNGDPDKILAGGIYWSIAFGCTNFPDLARILADLKLLRSDMGRTAMSAAIVTDVSTWILFVIGMASFSKAGARNEMMPYSLISITAFVLFCYFLIRPAVAWTFNNTVKGGHVDETHVWFILAGVILCSLMTELCGVQSITGAFLFGLSIPHDHIIRNMIEQKLHDYISGILMPLFYIICGLRADLGYMSEYVSVRTMALVISASFLVKILSTVVCSIFLRIPFRDGFAIGSLMNTKGTMALVILNAGRDTKALDVIMYTHMTLAFLVMSIVVQPLLTIFYRPKKKIVFYKNRTIQKHRGESELSVLTCVHMLPNVSGITNLLLLSNPTKRSPLNVVAIHLVELTGRTTASLLIMNDEAKPKANFSDRVRAESDQIAETFAALEVDNDGILVQTITAVSPYATMHEDISLLAEDKQVSFILMPYHKNMMSDGRLTEGNDVHAEINKNVLRHAPCSVGVLVDRGMMIFRSESFRGETTKKEVAMIFAGGRDDREALAFAWRIVGQEMAKLTVVRFLPNQEALVSAGTAGVEYGKEKHIDEECLYEFNFKTKNDPLVTYIEKVVKDGHDTIATIMEMEENNSYDLYIVGRGYKVETPVTAGLMDWSSFPDLGVIGDTLASSNFTMQASVLVVQQYSSANKQTAGNNNQEPVQGAPEATPFMEDEDDEEGDRYHIGMRK